MAPVITAAAKAEAGTAGATSNTPPPPLQRCSPSSCHEAAPATSPSRSPMWSPGARATLAMIGYISPRMPCSRLGCGLGTSSLFFDLDVDNDLLDGEAGRNFVVAAVFPSREVKKNGIKLSWYLACILGLPSLGRSLFISPLCTSQAQKETANAKNLGVIKCKNLYLSLVTPKVGSSSGSKSESDSDPAKNRAVTGSPKKMPSTPQHRSESHDFASNSGSSLCLDPTAARSALADEKVNDLLQICATRWLSGRYLLKGNYVTLPMFGKLSLFLVIGAELDSSSCAVSYEKGNTQHNAEAAANLGHALVFFLVDRTTKVHLSGKVCSEDLDPDKSDLLSEFSMSSGNGNEDSNHAPLLGGLSKEFKIIKEIISFSLADNIDLPRYKGLLLYGPPGTGKTSLASSCAHDAGANLFTINGPEIISQYYGESEQMLHDVFSSAKQSAPAVIFIDELDAIAPERSDGREELSIRMVATLLKMMDEIGPSDRVLLIAATNRPDSIDPALRRPGRLDREIEIGVPSPGQRLDILRHLLIRVHHSLTSEELEYLALATHGFVGADLAALCNEAALSALRRYISLKGSSTQRLGHDTTVDKCNERETDCNLGHRIRTLSSSLSKLTMSLEYFPCTKGDNTKGSEPDDEIDANVLLVTMEDFEKAKTKVRPSAMREVILELPNVRWDDVGGQEEVKNALIEAVILPQKYPDSFKYLGFRPARGLLMIGPPGCSKTLMARAVASEAKLNFLAVKGPELFSKWVGDSEKAVRSLFARARANAPAIIFFDEIDGLAVTHGDGNDGISVADRVISQLLVEMDGVDKNTGVTVIAATNRPDKIDPALLRQGRFDKRLAMLPPGPDEDDKREEIFQIHTRSIPCSPDVNLKELARLTKGYTGADIKLVCREAAVAALDEDFDIPEVAIRHFKSAIDRIKPSDIKLYLEITEQFCLFNKAGQGESSNAGELI